MAINLVGLISLILLISNLSEYRQSVSSCSFSFVCTWCELAPGLQKEAADFVGYACLSSEGCAHVYVDVEICYPMVVVESQYMMSPWLALFSLHDVLHVVCSRM